LTFRELISRGLISGTKKESYELMDATIPTVVYVKIVFSDDEKMEIQ
jgi:hypothetical protein